MPVNFNSNALSTYIKIIKTIKRFRVEKKLDCTDQPFFFSSFYSIHLQRTTSFWPTSVQRKLARAKNAAFCYFYWWIALFMRYSLIMWWINELLLWYANKNNWTDFCRKKGATTNKNKRRSRKTIVRRSRTECFEGNRRITLHWLIHRLICLWLIVS